MEFLRRLSLLTIFVLGITIALTIVLPALNYQDLQYTGLDIGFGKTLVDIDVFGLGTIVNAELPVSYFVLFAYGLPIIAGVIAMISKPLRIVSLVLFIVAFVLFISLPNTINIVYTIAGSESTAEVDWQIAYGVISALVLLGMTIVFNMFVVLFIE